VRLKLQSFMRVATAGIAGFPANSGIVGPIYDLAVHPLRQGVLLAVGAQLFKSMDGGRSWSRRDVRQASDDTLGRLVWDGGRPNRVFLLTSKSLFLSLDEGDTWTESIRGPRRGPRTTFPLFSALAVDRISGIVLCGHSRCGSRFSQRRPPTSWLLLSSRSRMWSSAAKNGSRTGCDRINIPEIRSNRESAEERKRRSWDHGEGRG